MGVDLCGTTILPLHFAAEEAWMSIKPLHVTAARLRFLLDVNGYGEAAARDGERSVLKVDRRIRPIYVMRTT